MRLLGIGFRHDAGFDGHAQVEGHAFQVKVAAI